jgi:hypothetical protein
MSAKKNQKKLSVEVKQRRKDSRTVAGLITKLAKQRELPEDVRSLIERAAGEKATWKADATNDSAPVDMKKAFIQAVRKLTGVKGRSTPDAIEAARAWLGIGQPAEGGEEPREEEEVEAAA